MITVTFNGASHNIGVNISLAQFLKSQAFELTYAALAINREFIPRDEYATTKLKANDKIECVMPMQGG